MTQTLDAVRGDLVAVVRDFTAREVLSRTEALDSAAGGAFAAVWRGLVELGLDRALLADELGGVGLDIDDFLCVLEEVAVGDAGVALAVLLNNAVTVSLPAEMAAGLPAGARWALAFAPGGGEPAGARVELTRDSGLLRVTGRLAAVLGTAGADGVVVAVRAPEPTLFAVATGTVGLIVRPDPAQLGLRAAGSADVIFDDVSAVRAPHTVALESRVRALVWRGAAAIARGIARRAREIALAYAHNRIQGGMPIVEHGAVSDMLAEMTVRMFAGTESQLGAPLDDPRVALAHKIAASDAAMATTIDAVQVMGGIGYMIDTGPNNVEKLMRDAKYCQLYPEPNWLGRDELMRLDRYRT